MALKKKHRTLRNLDTSGMATFPDSIINWPWEKKTELYKLLILVENNPWHWEQKHFDRLTPWKRNLANQNLKITPVNGRKTLWSFNPLKKKFSKSKLENKPCKWKKTLWSFNPLKKKFGKFKLKITLDIGEKNTLII